MDHRDDHPGVASLTSGAAAVPALAALPALAEPAPPAYALVKDYAKDARKMLDNMVIATGLARGSRTWSTSSSRRAPR